LIYLRDARSVHIRRISYRLPPPNRTIRFCVPALNGTPVRNGERVILRIVAANRDPERFHRANEIDITRRGADHLTLGAAPHSCVGANLMRMNAISIAHPLVKSVCGGKSGQPVDWLGGSFSFPQVSVGSTERGSHGARWRL
jgi:cytochrome P450